MESNDSVKLFNAMKEEVKSMDHNEGWDFVEFHEGCEELGVSGSLRPSVTLMAISNGIKLDLLPKVSARKMVLTIKRPFLLFQKRTHLELSWHW